MHITRVQDEIELPGSTCSRCFKCFFVPCAQDKILVEQVCNYIIVRNVLVTCVRLLVSSLVFCVFRACCAVRKCVVMKTTSPSHQALQHLYVYELSYTIKFKEKRWHIRISHHSFIHLKSSSIPLSAGLPFLVFTLPTNLFFIMSWSGMPSRELYRYICNGLFLTRGRS